VRTAIKTAVRWLCLVAVWPSAALSRFGRIGPAFTFFAHAYAIIPGLVGDYLRRAYYSLTLESCSPEIQVGFGTYFSHSGARIARGAGFGAYCIIGRVNIGERSLAGSRVHILSGQHQHARDADGRLVAGDMTEVNIGADCWIGEAAIIMSDVGPRSTIAAGAVVSTPVPAGSMAAGNPARVVMARRSEPASAATHAN